MRRIFGSAFPAWFALILSGAQTFAEDPAQPAPDSSLIPGVVIAHSPATSGRFIGSPSIVILPNGGYVASHDFFGPASGERSARGASSVVFSSNDKGKTWQKIADVTPMFWGKLFLHKDHLYFLGTRKNFGDVLIRRSVDGGRTWTDPATPETGLLRQGSYHGAPCRILVNNGRIWRSLEHGKDLAALVMSAPVDADLLDAKSWTFSQPLLPQQPYNWREGNVILDPDNNVLNILRTDKGGADKAAIVRVKADGKEQTYDPARDFIDMPGGNVKFTIRHDPRSARYWAIVNRQTNPKAYRNDLVLTSSKDLRHWKVESPLLHHPDTEKHAWQYVDWEFEGDDIIFVSRTAFDDGLGGAHNAHDANYLTFHRIPDFRNRSEPLSEDRGGENRPAASPSPAAEKGYRIPLIDLSQDTRRQVVVDRENGQYLGHPTTVLLEDGKTMIAVYPKGHGRGAIVMKRSRDGGKTWSDRLPTPENWKTSREVPTLYRTTDAGGRKRLILWTGLYPARLAVSEDDGQTWSELKGAGDWGGIVVMGFVEPLKTGKGHYLAMFHDDGRFFTAEGKKTSKVTLFKTFSRDGGLTWSFPEAVWQGSDVHLCEPGCIRSPDGAQMAVLLRENRRKRNSHVIFSNDEGKTWTEPRELPGALTGDRHTGKYAPDGRLFISFRDTLRDSPTFGDWVGWVGTYEDIVQGREGQYRVRLMDNRHKHDCAYPGVEVLPDGTFVATTYGHWVEGESPFIVSVRFTLQELDALAAEQQKASGEKDP